MLNWLILVVIFIQFDGDYQLQEVNRIVESPFYIVTANKYLIVPITIGSPSKGMNLVIDINSEYSWLAVGLFPENQSQSYVALPNSIEITQDDFGYSGVLSTERLNFKEVNIDKFKFALVKEVKNNPRYLGVISLSKKSNGLIEDLYNRNQISLKSFSVKYDNAYEGVIAFGQSIKTISQTRSLSKCVNGVNQAKWACTLSYISFGMIPLDDSKRRVLDVNADSVIKVNQLASFETIYPRINAPLEHYNLIKEKIFHIGSGSKCQSEKSPEGVNELICPIDIHTTIPQLNFIFNDQALSTNSSAMFHCKKDLCRYHLIHTDGNEQWQLGYHFLKHFHCFFSKEEGAIYFTSDSNNYPLYRPSNSTAVKSFGYLCLILLMLGISLLVFVLFIKRKNVKKAKAQSQFYSEFKKAGSNAL